MRHGPRVRQFRGPALGAHRCRRLPARPCFAGFPPGPRSIDGPTSPRRTPRSGRAAGRRRPARAALLRGPAGSGRSAAARELRHQRAPRHAAGRRPSPSAHILAISQAIAEYRQAHGITGPLFLGKDTHAVSGPAERTALEVLAANGVTVVMQRDDGFTPTPAVSRAILAHNAGRRAGPRRRHRHHALAQSAGRRRVQVQPARRRPRRHRCHDLDPGPRQRAARRREMPACGG